MKGSILRYFIFIFLCFVSLNLKGQTTTLSKDVEVNRTVLNQPIISVVPDHFNLLTLNDFELIEVESNDFEDNWSLSNDLSADFSNVLFVKSMIIVSLLLLLISVFAQWQSYIKWFIRFLVFQI